MHSTGNSTFVNTSLTKQPWSLYYMRMNTPSAPETTTIHEVAVSHCKQARVQVAIRFISEEWPNFWDMPCDAAMGDFKKIARYGIQKDDMLKGTQNTLQALEQGNQRLIQGFLEENPGSSVEIYKELSRHIIANFDLVDAEAVSQLGTITYKEIIAIMKPPTGGNVT